ncbi:MAG: hypothetical protein J6T85_01230 [Paludibacteraceae bacterium]|nr:hypothetical protein [Paludibacteraceae bacterium]
MQMRKTLSKILKKPAKSSRTRDLLVYLFFVLLATAMWFTHALNSVRTIVVPVDIEYEGVSEELTFSEPLPRQLQIEVRDQGKRLQTYDHNPLVLHIDLTPQIRGKEGEVRVSAEVIRRGINDQLQGTSKLLHVTPEHIQSTYSEQVTEKTFTVPVKVIGVPKGQTVRLFPQEVTVSLIVSIKHYNDVQADGIQAVCRYPKGEEELLEVEIRHKSKYISSARCNPARLEYIIEK